MSGTTPAAAPDAGEQLRTWRQRRRLSQLELGLRAGVSTKHLSFIETGRSHPSREMLTHLAHHLDIPIREHNHLLLAAGYAPAYPQRPLHADAMTGVRTAIDLLLAHHDPLPAFVVDRHWNLVSANTGAGILTVGVTPELLQPPVNVIRVSLHPDGLAPAVENFADYAAHLVSRLQRQHAHTADPTIAALLAEVISYPGVSDRPEPHRPSGDAVLPLVLDVGGR